MSVCGSCGAPIVWAVTDKGRNMPVDAQPSDSGNIELYDEGDHTRALVVSNSTLFDDPSARPRHLSHFATCPDADEHRKRKQ